MMFQKKRTEWRICSMIRRDVGDRALVGQTLLAVVKDEETGEKVVEVDQRTQIVQLSYKELQSIIRWVHCTPNESKKIDVGQLPLDAQQAIDPCFRAEKLQEWDFYLRDDGRYVGLRKSDPHIILVWNDLSEEWQNP